MSKPRTTMSRPHGFFLETKDSGKQIWQDSVQCCHCGKHHPWSPRRDGFGWCMRCSDWICPGPKCIECIPIEQQLENKAAGRGFRENGSKIRGMILG